METNFHFHNILFYDVTNITFLKFKLDIFDNLYAIHIVHFP